MGALAEVHEKISKKNSTWKGKHMSLGGRLIFTNSCLSSLPTYIMRFYLFPQGTHKKMDQTRAKFFWRGASGDFKYHVVRGRLIFTNSYLSSLPTYIMRFYLFSQGTHKKMDQTRVRFFWRGASGDFKYHVVKWSAVCRSK
jgi:hypothetical protein